MAFNGFKSYEQHANIGKMINDRKHLSKPVKDVEKKILSMNKKINDLQHQKRFVYKNSVKVKKTIHCQINQIVKCFRARERCLLSEVDEAYISHETSINEELSRLQSTLAHCQVLFNHLEDFRGNMDVLSKINSIYTQMNLEKSAVKSLELISDFEDMKANASAYGHLHGDFVHKDDLLVSSKYEATSEKFDPDIHVVDLVIKTPKNNLNEIPIRKRSDSQDSFEIIDLLENMHCQDESSVTENKNVELCDAGLENVVKSDDKPECNPGLIKSTDRCEDLEYSSKAPSKINGSCETDWEVMSQLKRKLQNCVPNSEERDESNKNIHYATHPDTNYCYNKKIMKIIGDHRLFVLNDASSCFESSITKKNILEKKDEIISDEKNAVVSPANIVQQSFARFLKKHNSKEWLSSN